MTRAAESRESQSRKKQWKPPSDLGVPEALERRMKSEGYSLRWVRIQLEGNPDTMNVNRRQREGYEFVRADEVPEWDFAPALEYGKWGNLVVVGDLALAKFPLELKESRTKYMEKKTSDLTKAIDQAMYENQRLNRLLPYQNTSRTKVYRGRRPNLDEDVET